MYLTYYTCLYCILQDEYTAPKSCWLNPQQERCIFGELNLPWWASRNTKHLGAMKGSSLGILITGLWGMCDSFAPCPVHHVHCFCSKSQQFYTDLLKKKPSMFFFVAPSSTAVPMHICTLLQPPGTKRDRRFRPWVVWVINFGRLWTCVRIAGPEALWCWWFLINIGCFPQIRSSHKHILPCTYIYIYIYSIFSIKS